MAPSLLPLTSKPSITIPRNIVLITMAYSIITITILLWSLKIFLFCPRTPTVQLNNLLFSNFKVSNSNLAVICLAKITIYNPNVALSVHMNQIEASILYKNENALSFTSVDDFELGFGERKNVYVKFETTGNEGDQPIVEYPVLREIGKDWRQEKMRFRIRLSAMTRYEIDQSDRKCSLSTFYSSNSKNKHDNQATREVFVAKNNHQALENLEVLYLSCPRYPHL